MLLKRARAFRMTSNGTLWAAYCETLQPLVVVVSISAVFGLVTSSWVGLSGFFDWPLSRPTRVLFLRSPFSAASPVFFAGLRLGVSIGFIGAISAERKVTPTGVGDIIRYRRAIADYPSMYAANVSTILPAVLLLNLREGKELVIFKGNQRGYASD